MASQNFFNQICPLPKTIFTTPFLKGKPSIPPGDRRSCPPYGAPATRLMDPPIDLTGSFGSYLPHSNFFIPSHGHHRIEPPQDLVHRRPRSRPKHHLMRTPSPSLSSRTRAHAASLSCSGPPLSSSLLIRPKRIYFSKHFCCCFSSNLHDLNETNGD